MVFIVEIILTVIAWKKGWGWRAILPVGIVVIVGIFWALVAANMRRMTNQEIPLNTMVFDAIAIIILLVMIFKPRLKKGKTK